MTEDDAEDAGGEGRALSLFKESRGGLMVAMVRYRRGWWASSSSSSSSVQDVELELKLLRWADLTLNLA